MSQHSLEMQERLVVPEDSDARPSPEPEPMAAPPELEAPSNSNALIQSTDVGAATNGEGQRVEAEPPKLSRDEELIDTATKMYRLGFCFLCAHHITLTVAAP